MALEVRELIYNYLLVDQNVSYIEPTDETANLDSSKFDKPGKPITTIAASRQRLDFQVSLFRVNKQISSESLKYFRKNNTFISIKTSFDNFAQIWGYTMPMIIKESKTDLQKARNKCVLNLTFGSYSPSGQRLPYTGFALTTLRTLRVAVRLFNAMSYGTGTLVVGVDLRLRNTSEDTPREKMERAEIRKCLRSIRGFELNKILETIDPNPPAAKPTFTFRERLQMAKSSMNRGDQFLRRLDYEKARTEYGVASMLIAARIWTPDVDLIHSWKQSVGFDRKHTQLRSRVHIAASILESRIGGLSSAFINANRAYFHVDKHSADLSITRAEILSQSGHLLIKAAQINLDKHEDLLNQGIFRMLSACHSVEIFARSEAAKRLIDAAQTPPGSPPTLRK